MLGLQVGCMRGDGEFLADEVEESHHIRASQFCCCTYPLCLRHAAQEALADVAQHCRRFLVCWCLCW